LRDGLHLPSGSVDFDFGRAGQINGFDVWRLADFAGDRLAAIGFKSRDELEQIFNAEADSGKILSSGYILHYVTEAVEAGTWPTRDQWLPLGDRLPCSARKSPRGSELPSSTVTMSRRLRPTFRDHGRLEVPALSCTA